MALGLLVITNIKNPQSLSTINYIVKYGTGIMKFGGEVISILEMEPAKATYTRVLYILGRYNPQSTIRTAYINN